MTTRARILIIEDNFETRELYTLALGGLDLDIQSFSTGRAALKSLENGPLPDLVLCDYMMPELSGGDLIKKLREQPNWSKIRVVLISGLDDIEEKAIQCGANASLRKPFGLEALEAIVLENIRA